MHNLDANRTWQGAASDTLVSQSDRCGAEWAYLVDDDGITILRPSNTHGWRMVATVGWHDTPDWERMDKAFF